MKSGLRIMAGVFLLAYLNFALGWVALPPRLTWVLAFGLGPAAIQGVLSLSARLEATSPAESLRAGKIFLIIAFALLTLMLTMQQAVSTEYQRLQGTTTAVPSEALRQAFALVNHIQLGADVAFDVFYALGMILISAALVAQTGLPRWVGVYGLGAGGGLLFFNLWTFPAPPASTGAIDLGPATIGWWIGLMVIARRNAKE
ncbi:MAG: hypothetical protein AB7U82_35465 [Blastocatellales bacterium]|nr:hypothetical protein [Nitrosomonas nitrosa]